MLKYGTILVQLVQNLLCTTEKCCYIVPCQSFSILATYIEICRKPPEGRPAISESTILKNP